MFRNFDNHDVYFDLKGNPLHGAIQVNLKDGTTPASIYDSDGMPIANPQLTDVYGKSAQQIFVNSDVRAYFYQYVGEGPMSAYVDSVNVDPSDDIDLSDESNWRLLYTVESAAIDERSITGESAAGVSTISALRAIDPYEVPVVDGNRVVTLYGYYEANDKEPVNYYFVEQSEQPDDNGAVIQPNDMRTGRWVMVQPTEHCDSRHYGVFPQDSASADIDHSTGIEQLISYCNFKSIRPYFNGSADYPYFLYTSLAVESLNPIDVSEGTKFVDKGQNNRFYGEWSGNPFFANNKTDVRCSTVKLSWNTRGHQNVVDYIIDTASRPAILSGVNVIMAVSPASTTHLTNCTVESVHKITNSIVLNDMEVKESWFAEDYDWSGLSIYGCDIQLKNFEHADTYVRLKNKQNDPMYGDLGEQEVHDAIFLADAVAENFSGTATCQGDAEIHNASATLTFTGPTPAFNAIDCWITVIPGQPFSSFALRRGRVVSASQIQVLNTARMENVDIDAELSILGGALDLSDCRINQAISHVGDPVVETVRDCVFNAAIQIRGGGTDAKVNAKWIGNHGVVAEPIILDRTNLAANDSLHTYKYEGNTGTFIHNNTQTVTFVARGDYTPGTPNRVTAMYSSGDPICSSLHGYTQTVSDGQGGYTDDPTKYIVKAKFFSIGTYMVRKVLEVMPTSPIVYTGGGLGFFSGSLLWASSLDHPITPGQQSVCSTLLFDEGYMWKIRNISVPCSANLEPGTNVSLYIREKQ